MKILKKLDNVKLLVLFELFREPLFWGPVIISFIINIGKMPLPDVYIMESVVIILMVFVEIYSSGWADLLGRKKLILIGTILIFVSMIFFAVAVSPIYIWVSNIMIMVGAALVSGADEAFLADHLVEEGKSEEYLEILGRIRSKRYIMMTFTSVVSGYLYSIHPRLPMFLCLPGLLFSVFIVLMFKEAKRQEKSTHKEHLNLVKLSMFFVANHNKIKWIIGYFAVIAVLLKIWFFAFNPYFELVSLEPKFYGWIFAGLNLLTWYFSKNAYRIKNKLGEKFSLVSISLLSSVPLMMMGLLVNKLSLIFVSGNSVVRGLMNPISSDMMNKNIDSKNRATVLSINSGVSLILSALCLWLFGLLLVKLSLAMSLVMLGLVGLAVSFVFLAGYNKIFN